MIEKIRDKTMRERFRKIQLLFCLIAFSGLLTGCASNAPSVNVDETQDFNSINSFYVKSPLNSVNPTLENSIAQTITDVLTAKGLTEASQNEADVLVGFFPFTESKDNGTRLNIGLGSGTFGRSGGISIGSVFSIPVGEQFTEYQNLQIDITRESTFVYSASGSTEIKANDAITVQRALNELVQSLLDNYPNTKDK
jgi:hypothetical protein